jgi:hypothetical protein
VSTEAAMPDPAQNSYAPTSTGRYQRDTTRPPPAFPRDASRPSVGEACRTLGALASATARAGQRREELARLRAEARAAVTGLVLRLRADDVPLERVLAVVRSAARDALPGSLMPAELRAIASDAARWASEAYWAVE